MKRQSHRGALRLFVLSAVTALVLAAGVYAADSGVITGDIVNARKGPGTGYDRVETLAKGRQVTILGEENGWYHIKWSDSTGYVHKDYISTSGSGAAASAGSGTATQSVSANATVKGGDTINVRSGAGTGYSRVALVGEGKRVAVLEQSGDWYKISFDGKTGYIHKDYVARDGSAAPAAASQTVGNASVNANSVNVRSAAGTSSSTLATVSSGKRVTLLAKAGGWYKVSFDGKTGYIYGDYITADSGVLSSLATEEVPAAPSASTSAPASEPAAEPVAEPAAETASESAVSTQESGAPRNGFVTGGTINVRTGPGTDQERVTSVSTGKQISILAEENGWFKVSFDNTTGYIFGDYVYEGDSLPESLAASSVGAQVAAMAPKYLGTPYVYGGSTPSGFDCSGFTMYLYKQFGYSLAHSTGTQYATGGRKVSKSELQPGDLVYFSSPSSGGAISHAAVYVGNGEIIHARYSVGQVYRNSLSESYYTKYYVGAIRVAE